MWSVIFQVRHQSINQLINLYRAIVQRRVLQCGYVESKRNVLRRILNVLTDGAVRQFSGREFQSLGAAAEKRRSTPCLLVRHFPVLHFQATRCVKFQHVRIMRGEVIDDFATSPVFTGSPFPEQISAEL